MENSELFAGKTVLIVEDSKLLQENIEAAFRQMGFEVVAVCNDGEEALEQYAIHKPDLVSLDIIMPRMHGIECFRKLLALNAGVKCIFVSCLAPSQSTLVAFKDEIPPFCFVPKPVNEQALSRSITKIFSNDAKEA